MTARALSWLPGARRSGMPLFSPLPRAPPGRAQLPRPGAGCATTGPGCAGQGDAGHERLLRVATISQPQRAIARARLAKARPHAALAQTLRKDGRLSTLRAGRRRSEWNPNHAAAASSNGGPEHLANIATFQNAAGAEMLRTEEWRSRLRPKPRSLAESNAPARRSFPGRALLVHGCAFSEGADRCRRWAASEKSPRRPQKM